MMGLIILSECFFMTLYEFLTVSVGHRALVPPQPGLRGSCDQFRKNLRRRTMTLLIRDGGRNRHRERENDWGKDRGREKTASGKDPLLSCTHNTSDIQQNAAFIDQRDV